MTEAIRTEHLKFSYDAQSESGGVTVFDDLNLSIEEGSFVAVLGHNGCGKSTLAKHFNAVLLPEGGSVQVFGMDTSDESLLVDIRRTVGMVFQNPDNQMVANVVEEDVAFAPENLGVPSEEIRRRVDEALKLVGMYDYRLHAPHLLSGGQKQRVAIARALAMDPKVMLLDEPTSALDPELVGEVLSVIRDLADGGMTMIMATHQMDFARALATDILFMEQGKIIEQGAPDVLLAPGSGTRTSDFCGKLFDLRGTEKSDEPTVSELLTGDLSHDITDDGSESSMIPDAPKKD